MSDGSHDTEVAKMPQGDDERVKTVKPSLDEESKKIGQLFLSLVPSEGWKRNVPS